MNEFKAYHPVVNFIYFAFVIGFSMFFMHPVCLAISLVCALVCSGISCGSDALKRNLTYMLPMLIATAIINPLFNHQGATIIAFFPNGNPLTLESILYGLGAGTMIACVICWFSCFNEVMTSDKFVYLFGKVAPSLSLLFSMILRFVPLFITSLKETLSVQKCLGHNISKGSLAKRTRVALSALSSVITRSFEGAVDTADSMRARGWGLKGRTSFSVFKFTKRDVLALVWIFACGIYIILSAVSGEISFFFFPEISVVSQSIPSFCIYSVYFVLFITPAIIEIWEGYKWKNLK